jgi:hypothetical protein
VLVAFPRTVETEIRPEVATDGTLVLTDVAVLKVATALNKWKAGLLLAAVVSKLVPEMLTDVPGVPTDGVNPLMVGGPDGPLALTVNELLLVAEPAGDVTAIGPVDAPAGTVVVN